jgi:MFS transporter, DHA1 family, multidrug resistance protein
MTQHSAGRVTLVATLLVGLGPFTLSMYGPAMPALAVALDTTPALVKQTLTVYLVAFAAGQLVYGPLSDRFGRRPVMVGGLLVYIAGSLLAAFAGSIEMLLAARVVQGVGACAGPATSRAIVRDLYTGAPAARILSVVGMAVTVAPAIAPVVGGYLEGWFGWHAIFLVLSVCGAVTLLAVLLLIGETNPAPDPSATDPLRMLRNYAALCLDRRYAGNVGLLACVTGGMFTYIAVSPFVFIDTIGLTATEYGWSTLVLTGSYFLGAALTNRLLRRIDMLTLVRIGAAVTVAGAVALMVVVQLGIVTLVSILAPMVAWMVGMSLLMPGTATDAMAAFPRIAGSAAALMGFLQIGAGALGSFAAAAIGGRPADALGIVPAVLVLVGAGLYVGLAWRAAPYPAPGE